MKQHMKSKMSHNCIKERVNPTPSSVFFHNAELKASPRLKNECERTIATSHFNCTS